MPGAFGPAGPAPPPAALGGGAPFAAAGLGMLGLGGVPVAPAVPKGTWIRSPMSPTALDGAGLAAGSKVEVATYDANGVIDGSALFGITGLGAVDMLGAFAEVTFKGASNQARAIECDQLFPDPGGAMGVAGRACIHFCRCQRTQGPAPLGMRLAVHVDTFRVREEGTLLEPWIRGERPGPRVGDAPDAPQDDDKLDEAGLRKKIKALKRRLTETESRREHIGEVLAHRASDFDKHKKKKKKKKRRHRDSSDTDTDTEEMPEDGSLFQVAPSRSTEAEIQETAQRHPGRLYLQGISEVTKWLGTRGGASSDAVGTASKVVTYLNSVFHGRHTPQDVGPRTARELRHVAECLDGLATGNLPCVADMLMQRFKALEQSVVDKGWATARHLELVPASEVGLASRAEQLAANKQELLRTKLEEAKARYRGSS